MVAKEQLHEFHFNVFFNYLPPNLHSILRDTDCMQLKTSSFSDCSLGFTDDLHLRIMPA
jgi:hypothetical protein